jgi:hypothetical protein
MTPSPNTIGSRAFRLLLAGVACAALAAPSLVLAAPGSRSPDGVWTELPSGAVASGALAESFASPGAYRLVQLDDFALFRVLRGAPREFTAAAMPSSVVLTLPMPDGTFARFRVAESPIISPKLAAVHPDVRTYVAQGLDDPTHSGRFIRTASTFHALIVTPEDFIVVEPATNQPGNVFVSLHKSELAAPDGMTCMVNEKSAPRILSPQAPPSGANLRTYDTAIVTSAEYTNFFGVANVFTAVTTAINAVNAIYEREVAIRFNLVCTTAYTNAGTDPFTNPDNVNDALLDQADATLDADCGANAYEVGHLFHVRAGGGNSWRGQADIGSACGANKGRGASTSTAPNLSNFVVDAVPHEMGHQFNANHTYNSNAGGCTQRTVGSTFEIGAGTTIMSYACAGCTGEQPNSNCADPYFHTHSFDQITDFREAGGNCGAQTATGNTAPSVSAGADYTIPRGTPFTLTASGSDPDGDAVTWCWEQYDLGTAASPPLDGGANGPLFRSFPAVASPSRTFPNLTDLLAGNPTPFEILPTVDRNLTFRATARDNRAGGGGVNYATMEITVAGDPFFVTYPNGGETFQTGCTINVQWTVGGGDDAAANVNILFSSDGGATFPTTLAAGVPNDGAQEVVLPCLASSQTDARIKVEGAGNIFFDVSNANFTVTLDTTPPEITVTLDREFLWPPNHKMVDITATVEVTDNCSNASFVLTSITSNEPPDDLGDGNTEPDWDAAFGTPAVEFKLRSERMGTRTGRIYTIRYTASDLCGNSTPAEVQVRVEHDQSGHAFVVQVNGDGAMGGDYLAVVVPSASATADGEETPVDRGAGSARRAEPPSGLLVGNTAGVTGPSLISRVDVDQDGLPDAVALFALTKALAIRASSDAIDGPVGLHYRSMLGESFLVPDLLAVPQEDASSPMAEAILAATDGLLDDARIIPPALVQAARPATQAEGIDEVTDASLPAVTRLVGFRPNPFFRQTSATFELARPARVTLEVYSPAGARVRGLVELADSPGRHAVAWDGRDDAGRRVPPGVYFVRFAADGVVNTGKALLLP